MTAHFAAYPSLKGRVVLVTGGASGIGADMVRAFHQQGSRVAFVDIMVGEGQALADELPGCRFITCDLLNIDQLKQSIEIVRQDLGPIGVLVNNAANDARMKVAEIDEAGWDRSQNINLRHQFFAAQAVFSHMQELGGGSIINFSSIAWRFGADTMLPYVTAKSAVIGLTHALARSFGSHHIRVNCIEPGAVMTAKQRQLWYPTQEMVDAMVNRQIIRKILLGDDVARMALFLAADDSCMITKQSFTVDAGMA
jgi:NAD(P)-dependent dehydrogenase (short-subunit alcohol dehydrogenase family)